MAAVSGAAGRRDTSTTVTTADLNERLSALDATLRNIETVLDLDRMRRGAGGPGSTQAAVPNLWDDPVAAQKVTSRLFHIQSEIQRVEKIRARLNDASVLLELAQSEDDPDTAAEAGNEVVALEKSIDELEVRTLLSGEYDAREALVTIRSGAGGWTPPTSRRCSCGCTCAGRSGTVTAPRSHDTSYAEEAGLKSATFAVKAPYAYGTLSVESGTHRLGPDQPVRQPGPAADLVRRGRSRTRGRTDRRHRHPRRRDPGGRRTGPRVRAGRASTRPTPPSG